MFALYILLFIVTCGSATNIPEQVHISLGDSPDTMVVMWSSRDNANWAVFYGKSHDKLDQSANASMANLPASHFKAAKFVYRSVLKNLSSSTYFYKIMCQNQFSGLESKTYKFEIETPKERTRYVVYGDMGAKRSDPTIAAITELHKVKDIDAILHTGDFAYDLHTDGGETGDIFMKEIEPLAAEIPYMTAPGNHEIPEEFQPYRIRFSAPNTEWPIPLNKMWYSFDQGYVHFISYSTEVYFTDNEEYVCQQFEWLLRDLVSANENRDKTPWIIAIGHRPMYCSNSNGDDCTNAFMRRWVKDGLESLFNAQGVDMILQAHEHSYERLYPLFHGHVERFNYTNPRAPVHIISGAAGSIEGTDKMEVVASTWSAFRSETRSFNSFGILEIHNSTHLHFAQINAIDNTTIDDFWLIQENHGPFIRGVDCQLSQQHESCTCTLPMILFRVLITLLSLCLALVVALVVVLVVMMCKNRLNRTTRTNRSLHDQTVTVVRIRKFKDNCGQINCYKTLGGYFSFKKVDDMDPLLAFQES